MTTKNPKKIAQTSTPPEDPEEAKEDSEETNVQVETNRQILSALEKLTALVARQADPIRKTPRTSRTAHITSTRGNRRRAAEIENPSPSDVNNAEENPDEEEESVLDVTYLGQKEAPKYVGKLQQFGGERSGSALETWIFQTEQYFEINQVPRSDRVPLASMHLRASALLWWRERCNAVKRDVEDPIQTWTDFVARLRRYLQPADQARMFKFKLKDLKQTGSLTNYVSEFLDLALQLPELNDAEKVDSFVWGLQSQTKNEVLYRNPESLEEAITIAERYDTFILRSKRDSDFSRTGFKDRSRSGNYRNEKNYDRSHEGSTEKPSFDRSNHRSDKNREQSDRVKPFIKVDSSGLPLTPCHNCGKTGHWRRNCKEPRKASSDSTPVKLGN